MLVCFLDDSGGDRQNSALTVAGYVATEEQWALYESEISPIYENFNVSTLHTVNLHQGREEFRDWKILRKQAFVASVSQIISRRAVLGVSYSVWKSQYHASAANSGRKQTVSPHTYCSTVILNWILTDVGIGKIVSEKGVRFVFEDGHANNRESVQNINFIKEKFSLHSEIRSVEVASKNSSKSIQTADLLAFYSRRHACDIVDAPEPKRDAIRKAPGQMLNIITERLRHRAFVATDFEPPPGAPIFLSDVALQRTGATFGDEP